MVWFLVGIGLGVLLLVARNLQGKGRVGAMNEEAARAPAFAGAGAKVVPAEWGWAKIHLKAANLKALGYYYRDRQAGSSFKIVVDLASTMDDAAIRDAARASEYRGSSTFRLGAHETLAVEGLPADFAAMLRAKYEKGDSPAGPQCAVILRLTSDERRALELPDRPSWVDVYL